MAMWMNMNAITGGGRWVLVGSSIGDDESRSYATEVIVEQIQS